MSSIWNNHFPRIAPFWCENDMVLHPDLLKEKNPTLVRRLNSRFLVLLLSLVPNITSKSYAKSRISPIADHLPPALFVWVEGGWPLHKFSQSLEASTEQVRRARAGNQRGARDWYDGNEDRTRLESDGKEKERELHCFFSSYQSYCPLSLTIDSNIPQKVIASDWGQGRGGEGAAVPRL